MTSPAAASLPALLVLTDRKQSARPLSDVVAAALDGGARAIVLREKDLAYDDRAELADALGTLTDAAGATLLVAGRQGWGRGVHLAASDPLPVPRPALVGRSCHDVDEVSRAGRDGCDYVTGSPVHPSPSKSGYGPPLGLAGLRRLLAAPDAPPVYALGGMTADNAGAAVRAGAAGVAVMGAVMRAERPERYVAQLLARVQNQCGRLS